MTHFLISLIEVFEFSLLYIVQIIMMISTLTFKNNDSIIPIIPKEFGLLFTKWKIIY